MKRTVALSAAVLASLAVLATPAWADVEPDCATAEAQLAEWQEMLESAESGVTTSPSVEEAQEQVDLWAGAVEKACSSDEPPAETTEPEAPPTSEPEQPPVQTTEPEQPPAETTEPETPPTSEPEVPPTSEPTTEPTSAPPTADERVFFRSCFEVFRAGAFPLFRGEDGYRPRLDRDDDGRACEREDFRRDRDRDDDDDDSDDGRDGEDGKDGEDGQDGRDGRDGVTTTVYVPTSDTSTSADVPLPVGGVATGAGPA